MAKKGENIYKRADGRWEGRYKFGFDEKGKTKYKSVYAKTYRECKEKLNTKRNTKEIEKNMVKVSLTVKELLIIWIESILINIKKSTADTYMAIINNHIIPAMGKMSVNMVSTEYLNKFTSEKINNGRLDGKGGLSAKTVQNIVGVIKSAFKYAEKIYGIKNPAAFITMPKTEKKELEILSDTEIMQIKNYCENNPDYFAVIYDLCLSTGIRIGELCALQCEDIDFENGILSIQKTVQRVKNDEISANCKTKIIISSPKTKNSVRKIPLPERLIKRLKYFTASKRKEDFIFSSDGKKPLDVRTIQKKFSHILKKCGIRQVKFHILRHTMASKWANSNFDIKGLSEILGHSSVNITLSLYVHSSVEVKRKQMNELFAV